MGQKLLLADDSVTIQRVIELTFADENIDVVAVSDGDQAIARIEADPPDIILADIGMPGRDGYAVAAHVKRSPRLAHIPVVLLTGAFEPVDQARAADVGSDGVLAKPFEPQLVISRVKDLLAHASPPAAPAPTPAPATLDVPLAPPPAPPGQEEQLDDYFDRLDAAFANLSSQPAPAAAAPAAPAGPEIDWFAATSPAPAEPAADLPLSYASPPPPVSPTPVAPAPIPQTPVVEVTESAPPPVGTPVAAAAPLPPLPAVAPGAVPSLGDAFAALLAAEQSEPSADAVRWPSATPEIGDDLIEEVTRRVLDRLSDRVVRETVGTIVSGVAERLVREEIERIKSSIK